MAKGPKLPGAPLGDIDPGMISPKVLEQIQKYQQEQKANITAQMKGSITAPLAKSVGPISELASIEPKEDKKSNTEKTPAAKEKTNENTSTDIKSLLKESKDQNTSLKKLIRLNEKAIEDNSEFYGRLEKTMNALLDSVSEQKRKRSNSTSGETADNSLIKSPETSESGGGFPSIDIPSRDKGKGKGRGKTKTGPNRFGRGLAGAAAGGLLGAGIFGMLSPEQQESLRALGIDEDAAGIAGSVVGGAAGAVSGKTPTPVVETAPVKPVVEEPQFKFNEKTGRFHDTMKGVGGGEMISDAKAKELGLEKPTPKPTPTEPVVEPKPVVEPAAGSGAVEKSAASAAEEVGILSKAKGALSKATSIGGKVLGAAAVPLTVGIEGYQSYEEYQAAEQARQSGEITQKEAEKQKTAAVTGGVGGVAGALGGAAVGAKGGAAAGAAVGALFGGVGAVPGAAIGGVLGGVAGGVAGAFGGRFLGKKVGETGHELITGKEEQTSSTGKDILETSTDPQEIFNELVKNDPYAQDPGVEADLKTEAHTRAKANIQKQGGSIKGYVQKPLTTSKASTKTTIEKPKIEAPKGNTEAGVTPDTDMGFQIEGRKEFDKELVNQQAATPGVTPDIAGVMPSANEKPSAPEQPKGKVEKPLSEEAIKLIDTYMKVYQYGLREKASYLPPETKKEDLVTAADEKYSFDPMMLRKLSEIKRTPGNVVAKLKEKKLEAADKLLQDKRIKNAESSDAGNLGTDYKATELTPTVETPTFDAMGNAGGVNISGGEEVQSAMEAARASDEGSMGLITTAREVSPELQKNSIAMQRSSNISKMGRSNAAAMDAFMGYNDDAPSLALPTADQAASMMGQVESTPKDEKINQIAESGSGQQTNVAPIIINNQGGDTYNTTTNASGGGSSGGAGSPTRTPNPFDSMVFGKTWEAYP